MSPMSSPSSSARARSALREMPQSTSTDPSGPSTTAAFPLEPLARTCRWISGVMVVLSLSYTLPVRRRPGRTY